MPMFDKDVVADDDNGFFFWCGWTTKDGKLYFDLGYQSEVLTIANLGHAASRIWTCAEPGLRPYGMRLCSSNYHHNTADGIIENSN